MDEFNMNWIQEALFLAEKAESEDEVPVGAVVVHQGRIVGKGYNRREQQQNPIAHAEILAIQDAAVNLGTWRLNECVLVVTLEPCLMCLAACQQARIQEVYYGAKDPKGGALSLGFSFHEDRRINHRFPVNYVEFPRCGHVLTEFFAKKRRT